MQFHRTSKKIKQIKIVISRFLRKPNFFVIFSAYLAIAPMFFGSVLVVQLIAYEQALSMLSMPYWWLLTIAFTLTSMLACTQPTLLALIYGYFLGWGSLPYLFFLNMAAIYLVNVLANRWEGHRFQNYVQQNPKAARLLANIRSDELKVIFFAKLSPVLPFALTNFIFAISGARLRNILLGGVMGMIPRTILAVWVGMQGHNLRTLLENNQSNSFQKIVLIALFVVSTLGLIRLIRSKLKG